MVYLHSTAIRRVEYDHATMSMQIWFIESGGPYNYCGVPQHVYEALVSAPSVGGYFNAHIRDRYQC